MPIQLDHMILPVADLEQSITFFTKILGCSYEGERDPFSVIPISRSSWRRGEPRAVCTSRSRYRARSSTTRSLA
jgi:catechol 2,3-dioxygenase-like lactoylglutathione lyase family enzyme